MKNKSIILLTSFSLAFSVAVGVATLSNSETKEAAAIGNYSTAADTYYNGITAAEGKQLAAQLHDLITSTHRYYAGYDDSGKNLYQQQTDQYYDANGNKDTGYIYEFYSGVKWPNGWNSNAGNTSGGYNREHCWCQSNSVNNSGKQMWGTTGGGSDMHHIRPVESRLNSTRSNHPYGEVSNRDSHKSYAKFGTNETYALGGYCFDDTFEPLDSKKGDVARIILYTYLHYNSYTVSDLFGNYGTTNGSGSNSYFTSSLLSVTKIMKPTTESDALALLLAWNESDPVDDIERRRNEQVAIYQGNRNPFIDKSSYADMIWGDGGAPSTEPRVNSVSVSPSSLELDVNGTKKGNLTATVDASDGVSTEVTWSSSNENVATVNSSGEVTAKAKGSCTITATSTYNTSKSASCTVKVVNTSGGGGSTSTNYELYSGALAEGDYVIYYSGNAMNTTESGNRLMFTAVTPSNNIISSPDASLVWHIAPSGNYWTIYNETEQKYAAATTSKNQAQLLEDGTDDKSLWSCSSNSNSTTYDFANKARSTGSDSGNKWLRKNGTYGFACYATGTGGALSLYKQQSGTSGPALDSISLNTSNVQTEFVVGDIFDYSGLVVVASYSDKTEDIVNPTDVSTPDMSTAGDKTVTVSYTEDGVTKTDTYTITVSEPEPTVDSVELDVHELELDLHGTASSTLSAEVIGENNPPQGITWESSDTSVATVSDAGVVTAVAEGECIVTAYSTYDDEYFDTCAVTVVDSGEIPTTDGTISFSRSGNTNTVTDGYTFIDTKCRSQSGYYQDKDSSTGLEIGIKKNSGNTWSTSPSTISLTVIVGGGVVRNQLNNNVIAYLIDSSGNKINSSETIVTTKVENTNGKEYTVSMPATNNVAGVLICHEKETSYNVRIYAITLSYSSTATTVSLSSITLDIENVQKQFFVGDTFTYEGLVVTAHYSDESSSEVTPTSVSSPNMSTAGEKTITVTYIEDEVTKTATYTINVEEQTASSISAMTELTHYYPGDVITKNDITVFDDLDNEITNFDFENYEVTYENTPGGDDSEEIILEDAVTYGNLKCDVIFSVCRNSYHEISNDTMTKNWTGASGTSYSSWSNYTLSSGVKYAGNNAGGNSSIQLRSKTSSNSSVRSGIVATSACTLDIYKVSVKWNSNSTTNKSLDIYGKNTAYTNPNDLYDSETAGTKLGSITCGSSTELVITGSYKYIGLRSASDTIYLDEINVQYGETESASNVSNFIMYEDAEGQCVTKFDQALDLLNTLSSAEKELFWNSDDYVISHARERLQKWAIHEKVTLSFIDDEFVANSNKNINLLGAVDTSSSLIIVLVSLLSISSIAGYFLIKRKKEE